MNPVGGIPIKMSPNCQAGTINVQSPECHNCYLSSFSYFTHFFDADLFLERLLVFFQHFFEADLLRERLLDFLPPFFEADLLRERLLDFLPLFLEADLLRERLLDFLPHFFDADLLRDRLLDFFPPGLFERDAMRMVNLVPQHGVSTT